ncbi:MAG: hypothetical protein AABY15_06225 [Nanoarchaeota archaeon]
MKRFTLGEICFIVIGIFAPATTSSLGIWGLLLLSPICGYAGYYFYHEMKGEITIKENGRR